MQENCNTRRQGRQKKEGRKKNIIDFSGLKFANKLIPRYGFDFDVRIF